MTNPTDRYAIVALPPHSPVPDGTVMWGDFPTVMENIEQSVARQDAIEQLEFARIKSDQIETMQNVSRALQVASFCDSVEILTSRMDAIVARRTERARRDAEEAKVREQQLIEDALSKLPDPNQPHEWNDDGELTTHEPTEPTYEEQLAAIEHPADNEGDLPKELTEQTPPITGTDPDFSNSREPTARNPVALSFSDKRGDLATATRLPPPPISADSLYPPGSFGTFFLPDPPPR